MAEINNGRCNSLDTLRCVHGKRGFRPLSYSMNGFTFHYDTAMTRQLRQGSGDKVAARSRYKTAARASFPALFSLRSKLLSSKAPTKLVSSCSLRHFEVSLGNDLRVTDPLLHLSRNTRRNILSGPVTRNQFALAQLMFCDTMHICEGFQKLSAERTLEQ